MPEKITELREKLAELCHSQWNGWMVYLFSKGEFNNDGTWTMPVWAVDRWTRQMRTLYADLPTEEKDTDRKEADKFLEIFKQKWNNYIVAEDDTRDDSTLKGRSPDPTGELLHRQLKKSPDNQEKTSISALVDEFRTENGLWAEYPDCPRKDWQHEVMNGCTILGYWKWVEHAIESDAIGARLGKAIVQARKDDEQEGEPCPKGGNHDWVIDNVGDNAFCTKCLAERDPDANEKLVPRDGIY